MKYKSLIAVLSLVLSMQAGAQALNEAGEISIPIGFSADVGNLFEKGAVPNFTDKYNGYQSAKVFFNANIVKLIVVKKADDCNTVEICPMLVSAPVEVYLQVKAVVRLGCYDSYYAKTPDNVKSAILEQVIIHRFAPERCQTLVKVPDGSLHYKISGINSKTGEMGSAEVFSNLLNLQFIKITK